MSALRVLLPAWDASEQHRVDLACAPERAFELALSAPAAPDAPSCALLRYWRVVGPCSALLRRRWLRAVEREASGARE